MFTATFKLDGIKISVASGGNDVRMAIEDSETLHFSLINASLFAHSILAAVAEEPA